jgi:hypothetical protein
MSKPVAEASAASTCWRASSRDQAERFPLCRPQPLQALFERVGLSSIACDDVRLAIRRCLESRLAPTPDGPIELTARAWAVQGVA